SLEHGPGSIQRQRLLRCRHTDLLRRSAHNNKGMLETALQPGGHFLPLEFDLPSKAFPAYVGGYPQVVGVFSMRRFHEGSTSGRDPPISWVYVVVFFLLRA